MYGDIYFGEKTELWHVRDMSFSEEESGIIPAQDVSRRNPGSRDWWTKDDCRIVFLLMSKGRLPPERIFVAVYHGSLISGETDTDHIHLLVEMPPQVRPSDLIRILKTQLSRETHRIPEYDAYIKQYLHGDAPLWSPSYFIATTGTTVLEKVKDYIDSQRTDEHHQKYSKYVKSGLYRKNRR